MKCDVIIIGAGPAGLSFACSLANTGLNVVIIEKLSKKRLLPLLAMDVTLHLPISL